MRKKTFFILTLFLLLALSVAACGDKEEPTTFSVDSSKEDVDVRSTLAEDTLTFYVYSPSGIGDATFALTGGPMPDVVEVRLFVKGLENLELSYDDVTITASVPTSGGPTIEKVNKGGEESELDGSSPYWLDIQPLPAEEGGLFVGEMMEGPSFLITLPEDFHDSNATEFTLKWVDFYR